MDPFLSPPAFTAVAGTTANNGLAAPVDPSAAHAPPTFNHPPYEEMIFAAITALKETDGSSKIAISKYIEQVYSELPLIHSPLLSQHLKRLIKNGSLVKVKNSYKLAGSELLGQNNYPPAPDAGSGGTTSGAKRGRGRPPKPKSDAQPGVQPVLAALGLVDEPVKKGRGRPKKDGLGKRGPGRPPKNSADVAGAGQQLALQSAVHNAAMTGPSGLKRRPGRPPKNQATLNLVPYAAAPIAAAAPRGRPRKTAAVAGVLRKGPGRPPKVFGVPLQKVIGIAKPRRVSKSGKPLGRPRKKLATEEPVGNWAAEYEDAKKKLEYFQLRVQRVVAVLKPQLDPTNDDGMAAAMEELEELSTMDISAPLQEQVHPLALAVADAPEPQI